MPKILVVDDDRDFIKITRMILQSNNYEVITAAEAAQGQHRRRGTGARAGPRHQL